MTEPTQRPTLMALDVLVSHLVAAGLPVGLHAVTALRERVEDTLEDALVGVEIGDMPEGWSAEEALEQVAMRAAMEMLVINCPPPSTHLADGEHC